MGGEVVRAMPLQGQSDRFEAAMSGSGAAPERARMAKVRYLAAREALSSYERQVARAYGEMGLSSGKRRRLQPLAQRPYRVVRRFRGEKLYSQLAVSVRDRLIEGMSWVDVLAVVEQGMRVLGGY